MDKQSKFLSKEYLEIRLRDFSAIKLAKRKSLYHKLKNLTKKDGKNG